MDQCTGMFPTAEACIMMLEYWWFVAYRIESVCFHASFTAVRATFARRVLNSESDITENAEVGRAAWRYLMG